MEKNVVKYEARPDGVISSAVAGEQLRAADSKEGSGSENEVQHVFNEQTNYVPKKTIITVSLPM